MKHDEAEIPEGATVVPDLTDNDPYPYKMNDVAKMLGLHRVTLLRKFQSNKVTVAPKWRKLPTPHRVFSKADFDQIKKELDALRAVDDREYLDEVVEVEEAE